VQKCQNAVIAACATRVVRSSCLWRLTFGLIEVNPPFRNKFTSIGTPEVRRAVDGPRWDDDLGMSRHGLALDDGGTDAVTDSDGDGRVKAKSLITNAIEKREGLENGRKVIVWW
jgi:hypothetical protein